MRTAIAHCQLLQTIK